MNSSQQSAVLERGLAFHRRGDLAAAQKAYEALLSAAPRNTDALHLLGLATAAVGSVDRGIEYVRRAVELQPVFPAAWFNLGNLCHKVGRLDDAIAAFRRAHQQQPKNPDVLCNLANCFVLVGKYPEAEAAARNAIALNPRNAMLQFNLGIALAKQGKLTDAVDALVTAATQDPTFAAAWEELGIALHTLQRREEAVTAFEHALRLNSTNAVIWCELGECLFAMKRCGHAQVALDRAISLDPRMVAARLNRGALLQHENRFDEALREYATALEIDPGCSKALSNIGTIRIAQGDLDAAEASFRKLLSTAPEYKKAAWNLAVTLLTKGEYAEGWRLYEHRWENEYLAKARRQYPCPLWLGQEAIAGKSILVHAEQGFGDTLQFARYIPVLAAAGATVHFQVQPALLTLLQSIEGASTVSALGAPAPATDFHAPLLSLPLAFGTTLDSIPHRDGYLSAPPGHVAHWAKTLSSLTGRRIGVTWSGNRNHDNDHNRSIPFAKFRALLTAQNCSFVLLQKEVRSEEEPLLAATPALHDYRCDIRDFADTAAIISQLDFVIAVDTSTAHLAAALGTPTSVLLPLNADWRWLRNRNDSPWYSAARLLRQSSLGDWGPVIAAATEQLENEYLCRFA